jgi:Tfp pilus assembly protein PilO
MSFINPNLFAWLLRTLAKKIGLWGLLSLVVLSLGSVMYFSKIAKLEQEIGLLNQTIIETEQQATKVVTTQAPLQQKNSKQSLNAFYQTFPTSLNIPDTFSQLNALATKHQLALNSGDYKLNKIAANDNNNQKLTQYEMVIPIVGSYPNIRWFIADMLSNIPSIALTDLQLKRENVQTPKVDARLQMIIFVRSDAS